MAGAPPGYPGRVTLLLLLACVDPEGGKPAGDGPGGDDSATSPDTAPPGDSADPDDTATDTAAPPDPAGCAPDHTWLPDAPEVVSAASAADYSFYAWQLDAWLFLNGLGWLTPVSHDVRSYRIRYTTQDRGRPVEATAVVSVPVLAAESARGTLLWTHPTSGYEDACAPSRGIADGLAPAIVSAARGYVVVAPDYLGLAGTGDPAPEPHPWIVSEPSAIVALDALRAADAWLPMSGEAARVDRAHVVYWGWSEGGYVALQADRWAPTWAPEHVPVGVVAAVPPLDIRGQVAAGAAGWSPATPAGALILYLAARWYGEDPAGALLPEVVDALPAELEASCGSWPSVDQAGSPEALFQPALLDALRTGADLDPWTCLLDRSSLPAPAVPHAGSAPVLLITGEADTLVPTAPTREAIPALCAEGYTLEHVDCAGLDHGDPPLLTLSRQLGWIDARMRDEPVTAGCGVSEPEDCG